MNATYEGAQLAFNSYLCNHKVDGSGRLDGYTKVENSTCSHCSAVCAPPKVNGVIYFFDGFNCGECLTAFFIAFLLTIAWQVYLFTGRAKQKAKWDALMAREE